MGKPKFSLEKKESKAKLHSDIIILIIAFSLGFWGFGDMWHASEYSIVIGERVLNEVARHRQTARATAAQSIVIITDENVWRWHGFAFLDSLEHAGAPTPLLYVLPLEGPRPRTKEAIELHPSLTGTNRFLHYPTPPRLHVL